MAILEIKNVTKEYGKKETLIKALNNISLKVEEGEFISIVGTSGSGKSTLLHIIGGVDTPSRGEVLINAECLTHLNDDAASHLRRTKIGLIYQFYNLLPTLNVRENIILPLELEGSEIDETYFTELIELLNLKDRLKHLPNELSGGQQQRVAIARALITKPSILLADEPTGNLDSKNSQEILSLLKTANEKYKQTIILVTHDEKLTSFAKRIITIQDGEIV